MIDLDFEIYDGKTFRHLCKEVIVRSENKKDQLDTLISDIRGHIKNINDAQVFIPRIKELLEVGIKNDEQLIKLSSVLQKIQSSHLGAVEATDNMLTDEEKAQLIQNNMANEIKSIKAEVDAPIIKQPII